MDKPDKTLKTPSVTDRLISLVTQLPEKQQEDLLKQLERMLNKEKRRHPRKSLATLVDFVSEGHIYREFARDISESGLYIQTSIPFSVGQDVVMTFAFPDARGPLKIAGRIARVDDGGIGVQFNINSLVEALSIRSSLKKL